MTRSSTVRIAVLGDRDPALPTHRELDAALAGLPGWASAQWVASDSATATAGLDAFDAVWVAPGSPYADDDAVLRAIGAARMSGQPLLGTCGGFQYLVLEYARSVAGLETAAHAEVDPEAEAPVVDTLSCSLVGAVRPVRCVAGTRLAAICGLDPFGGYHFCGFGLSERAVGRLEAAGLVVGARAPDAGVEAVELPGHPFFTATLFQPQVGALAGKPTHPLIGAFLAEARAAR